MLWNQLPCRKTSYHAVEQVMTCQGISYHATERGTKPRNKLPHQGTSYHRVEPVTMPVMGRYSKGSIFRRFRIPGNETTTLTLTFGISNLRNIEQLPPCHGTSYPALEQVKTSHYAREPVTMPWNKPPCHGLSYHATEQVTTLWNK